MIDVAKAELLLLKCCQLFFGTGVSAKTDTNLDETRFYSIVATGGSAAVQ